MKHVVVLRHAQRQDRSNNHSHLSQEGVNLARKVGASLGPFNLVVTSPLPRALETAVAMGFAVNEELMQLQGLDPYPGAEVRWDDGYAAWGDAYRLGRGTTQYVESMAQLCRDLASRVPDGGSVLAVTHGGVVEACAVGSAPDANHPAWGAFAGYCEGVRITLDDCGTYSVDILRVR